MLATPRGRTHPFPGSRNHISQEPHGDITACRPPRSRTSRTPPRSRCTGSPRPRPWPASSPWRGLLQPRTATATATPPRRQRTTTPVAAPDPATVDFPLECGGAGTTVAKQAPGDLDGDGRPETVAVVHCDAGSGTPPSGIYVLTQGSGAAPRVVATLVDPADKKTVGDFAVREGRVSATLLGYSSLEVPALLPRPGGTGLLAVEGQRLRPHLGRDLAPQRLSGRPADGSGRVGPVHLDVVLHAPYVDAVARGTPWPNPPRPGAAAAAPASSPPGPGGARRRRSSRTPGRRCPARRPPARTARRCRRPYRGPGRSRPPGPACHCRPASPAARSCLLPFLRIRTNWSQP